MRDPQSAARKILAWNLPGPVVWQVLAVMAIAYTLVFSVSSIVLQTSAGMPPILSSPIVFFLLNFGGLVLTSYAFFLASRTMQGGGTFKDILILLIWLQALQLALQV
ncbi:MAG: YIP1 family protein, partial [Sulfitobacter sp.]